MRKQPLFRLLSPIGTALAGQLARPSGWLGRLMLRVLNRGNRQLIRATLAELELGPSTRLLDVGFGGGLALELARARGVRRLAGVDPSAVAVERLLRRPGSLAGAELRAEVASVERLPFEGRSFHAAVSTNTIYFWPDLGAAFAELARVLAPGGRLALGYSGAEKLRSFDSVTRHGFHLHENEAIRAAAAAAGLRVLRLVELHGGDTEGDFVLVAEAPGPDAA